MLRRPPAPVSACVAAPGSAALRSGLAVLALALPLAACGGGPGAAGGGGKGAAAPVAVVRAAADRSTASGSSRFALTSTTVVAGKPVEVTGEGLFDYAHRQGSLVLKLPGSSGSIEERVVASKVYVALTQRPGTYYALDLAALQGTSLGASTDPGASVAALDAASGVKVVGHPKVRGEGTTQYRGTLDVKAAVAKGGAAGQVAQATLGRSGVATVPFDAWVDDAGRLRKYATEVTVPAGPTTGGQPVRSRTTVELFDYGVDVQVKAPAAASVKDGAPLLAALKGSSGG